MRFRHLHSMTPMQRMDVLEAQFPAGTRTDLFQQCAPGEYERLFKGVPAPRIQRWSNAMVDLDRDAWGKYNKRTAKYREEEAAQLAILRPPLKQLLETSPLDVEELLVLPRLLGDPVDTHGVRLFFRREAFGGSAGVFERVYKVDELTTQLERLQLWGAAPFVALHGIPYGETRNNASVRYARVVSADWDAKHEQVPPEDLLNLFPPDLFVQSGGGFHAYWRIPDDERGELDMTQWRRVGLALCRALNADEDAVLGSQIMRLPGSAHLKNPAEPRKVRVLHQYAGAPRRNVINTLISTFKLVLRDEDTFNAAPPSEIIDVDPEEHPALAVLLEALQDQGLQPRAAHRGWTYYCPCHECERFIEADLEDGTGQEYFPKRNSTPSGIVRVNADRSIALFCGSTQRCGAGPRAILEALGLHQDLAWLECGGFLNSDFGKRYKAARIADGTWKSGDSDRSAKLSAAGKKGARIRAEQLAKAAEDDKNPGL